MNCAQCQAEFTPRKSWQRFCSPACRQAHHDDRNRNGPEGMVGTVKVVRKLKCGVSVVMRFTDPEEAERAIKLNPGQLAVLREDPA